MFLARPAQEPERKGQPHLSRLLAVLGSALCLLGCHGGQTIMTSKNARNPHRDINAVLADHDEALLARPGVVGVCVALMPDGKTPCIKVLLAQPDPALCRSLPRQLEGYPVRAEVTGAFRPLNR